MTTMPIGFIKKKSEPLPSYDWVVYDDFNDNSINTSLWQNSGGANASNYIAEQNQRIEAFGSYSYTWLRSLNYNFPHTNEESLRFRLDPVFGAWRLSFTLLFQNQTNGEVLAVLADQTQGNENYCNFRYRINAGSWVWLREGSTNPMPKYNSNNTDIIVTYKSFGFNIKAIVNESSLEIDEDVTVTPDGDYRIRTQTSTTGAVAYYLDQIDITDTYIV